jgi:hypothetical protein
VKRRVTLRISVAVVALGSALVITGCAGSSGDASNAAEQAEAIASAAAGAASAAESAADVAASAGAIAGGKVSAEEFCDALKKAQPKLDKQVSEEIAFVTLTLELANLYASKNALPAMDASTMDALAGSCPKIGAEALKSTGKTSFTEFR